MGGLSTVLCIRFYLAGVGGSLLLPFLRLVLYRRGDGSLPSPMFGFMYCPGEREGTVPGIPPPLCGEDRSSNVRREVSQEQYSTALVLIEINRR